MSSYRFEVPRWHPTLLNVLLASHWSSRRRRKRQDAMMIALYGRQIPNATGKRRLTIEIHLRKGQRAGDPDAYYKSLADALVHAGLLKNDSALWVELAPVRFERSPDSWGTTIVLDDLDEQDTHHTREGRHA